jgi:polysaccharide chain length determinant protein (PEP-CTERM system associated)
MKLPDRYRSETVILVDSQKIPNSLVSTTVNKELQDRIATISKQILGSNNLLKVINDFHLYSDERAHLVQEELIEKMRNDISIKMETGWAKDRPGAFRVTYQGKSASVVAAVATRLGNLFIEENLKSREVEAEGTAEFLRGRLQEAKQTLDLQEEKVRQYKEQYNGQLPDQGGTVQQTMGRLESQLRNSQELLMRAQEAKRSAQNSLEAAESSLNMITDLADRSMREGGGSDAVSDPQGELYRKRRLLAGRIAELRISYSENHPDVRAVKTLLEQVNSQLGVEEAPKDSSARVSPRVMPISMAQSLTRERERLESLRSQVKTLNREIEQRESERQNLIAEIAKYQKRSEQLPIREQEVAAMMRDYETSQMHYRSLLDKIFAAETAAEMERRQKAERFTILDPARVPEKPFSPKRPLYAGIGAGVSLVLALVACLGWEIRKNKFLGEWELPSNIPVLGRIPAAATVNVPRGGSIRPLLATVAASVSALLVICITAFQMYRG